MRFTKMHGAGNDYIYLDCTKLSLSKPSELAIRLSDRHTGIGGDGLILIYPSEAADFRMEMYNSDGSLGNMCGNGIRCVAKFVYDKKLTDKKVLMVETASGIKHLVLHMGKDDMVSHVTVDMGKPALEAVKIPTTLRERPIDELFERCSPNASAALSASGNSGSAVRAGIEILGKNYEVTCVSVGNPHAVVFLQDDVDTLDLEKIGPHFERHTSFPDRVNTEFVNVIDRGHLKMRVWERGSGETMACGTGTCAVLVAGIMNGHCDMASDILTRGGVMNNRWDMESGGVFMTGPAATVFEGDVE